MRIHTILIALSIAAVSQIVIAATVTVDFAQDKGPIDYRASGFLHSFTATSPGPTILEPLKPKFWRTNRRMCDKAAYDRCVAMGVTVQLVISDTYGTHAPSDWSTYETWVTNFVNANRAAGINCQYDVWNEPEGNPVDDAFYHAYRAIKAIDSSIMISAPSTWTGPGAVTTFLQNLATKYPGIYPDYLGMHANTYSENSPESYLTTVRAYVQQHNIPIKGIQINEMIADQEYREPFWQCKYLAEVDRNGASHAALACWNTCWDPMLDGLLTWDASHQIKSNWWVHKAYADITGRRAGITRTTTGATLDGIMGFDAQKKELRGVFAPGGTVILTNLSATGFLSSSGSVDVETQQIAMSGDNPSSGPVQLSKQTQQYSNNQLSVTVSVPSTDAFILIVRAGTTAVRADVRPQSCAGMLRTNPHSVSITANGPNTVSIMNLQGKLLSRTTAGGSRTLSLDNAKPGAYLVNLETPEGVASVRIVKDR